MVGGYSDNFGNPQLTFDLREILWLELQSVIVTFLQIPEGVTVTADLCTVQSAYWFRLGTREILNQ